MTRGQLIAIVALIVSVFAASCRNSQTTTTQTANSNRGQAASTPDQFARARGLFEKDCQSCHGSNGAGGPVKLEDGTKLKVPSLREGHATRHPDSDFVKQITKGGDGMPAFEKKLTTEETSDLIRFIRHEFQAVAAPAVK